jgi:diguanylate cyclase (GGDEF)-like protein/PAS domain S-box-containing protein
MQFLRAAILPLNTIAALVVVIGSLLLPPGVYGYVAYSTLVADMDGDLHVAAGQVETVIAQAPQLWKFQDIRIREMMSRNIPEEDRGHELMRLLDGENNVVAAAGAAPRTPIVRRSTELYESGRAVGRLELQRSLRNIVSNSVLLLLFGIALAMVSLVTLRVIPLRAVLRANDMLREGTEALTREVEERKRTEAALRESQQIVRAILDTVPARIFWKDKNLVYLGCNAPFARDAGFARPDDIVGKDDYQMGWRDQADLYRSDDRQVVETGQSKLLIEEPQTTPDGQTISLLTNKVPLRDSNGEIFGLLGTYMDVTERARLQQAAQERLRRTAAQIALIGEIGRAPAVLSGEVEALAREIVERGAKTMGCERVNVWLFNEDETELRCIDLYETTPARHSAGMILRREHFQNELDTVKANRYVAADEPLTDPRTASYVEVYIKPLRITAMLDAAIQASDRTFGLLCFEHVDKAHRWEPDEIAFAGQLADKLGLALIARQRHEAEEALQRSEEKFRNLVESTTDYIWEIGQDGRYTYVSPAVKPMLGYEPQELMGKSPFDLMSPVEAERVRKLYAPIAEARQPFSMLENTVLRRDGSEIVLETSGVPVFDKAGALVGYRGIDRDITERKNAELALQRRDILLHAAAASATELVTAANMDEAIQNALEQISNAIQVDRILVLERPTGRATDPPVLRYVRESPRVPFKVDQRFFESPGLETEDIAAWNASVRKGRIAVGDVRTVAGDVKKLFEQLGIKKNLIVPVLVDGKFWGQIGFDSCDQERVWADFEIEILQTMAELIGTAIQRDRYVKELADANRIVQNTPTVLYRLKGEPSLPMIYVSQNVKLFGYEPAALMASPHLYQSLVHPDDVAMVRESQARTLDKDRPQGVFEFRLMTSSGDFRWVENRYAQIRDDAGRISEIEGLMFDITEHKAAEEKIARLARTDPLTGLPNRTTFIDRLRQAFAAARRGAPPFAVLYLDLDRFKDINDTLGHPVGDSFLIVAGERLKDSVRDTDVVARLGGDEFAILQTELHDTADAGTLATKLRAALAEPMQIEGNELHGTASIGIAIYGPEILAPEDMLAHADVALYRAKEEGRDQYRFHTEELDVEVRRQVAMSDELRTALNEGQFELHYQPQVDLYSGRIVGIEALIRWNHPTRGLLTPSAFIEIAERTGAIGAIGQWVLDTACRQMRDWRKSGIAPPSLAVNISAAQIKSPNEFVEFVTDTLAKWGLAPSDLELDVTESMLARATLTQNDVLERLQKLGVKISIDDFGTKYSSLDYLRTYRVNRLKIPRPLVNSAIADPDSAAMVRAIVGIARELNIEVIAQGVETEAQWSFLTATSPVSKVQGYYYSEPVPADDAEALLRRGRIDPAVEAGPPAALERAAS